MTRAFEDQSRPDATTGHQKSRSVLARFAALGTVGLMLAFGAGDLAAAPKLCLPEATGVAFQSGPPNWWDTNAGAPPLDTIYNRELMITTDPRWRGALGVDYSQGGPTNGEFRGVYKAAGKDLLLSWAVKGMNFSTNGTALVVGIKPNNGSPVVIRLNVKQASTEANGVVQAKPAVEMVNGQPVTYLDPRHYTNVAQGQGTEVAGAAPYPWATDATRIWIKPTSTAGQAAWLIQMRIPMAQLPGFNADDSGFRMWFSMQPSISISGAQNGLVHYTWPKETPNDPTAFTYYFTQGAHHLPDPSTWGEIGFGQQAGCAGIRLAGSDIGVVNAEFPGQTSRISLKQKNVFFALPQNMSGATADLSKVTATFYFANWGSTLGEVTNQSWRPEDTLMTDLSAPNPNTDWHVASPPPNPPVAPGATLGPDVATGSNGLPVPNAVPDTKKAQLWREWTLSQVEQCRYFDPQNPAQFLAAKEYGNPAYCNGVNTAPYQPKSVHPHACMLVKLNGPGHVFLNDSAFRNMNFGTASVFERQAEINVAGLKKSRSGAHDVYLFVDKRNMPAYAPVLKYGKMTAKAVEISPEIREINALLRDPRKIADIKTPLATQLLFEDPVISRVVEDRNPMLMRALKQEQLRKIKKEPKLTPDLFDALAAVLPTYAMHVFHDLEHTVHIDGQPHRLLGQQGSFGVYLLHDQPYYGWIEQMNRGLIEVAPGVRKLSIPNGRTAVIKPRLEAVETIKPITDYREIALPIERMVPSRVLESDVVIR